MMKHGSLIAGAGGALLIVSLFLPWASVGAVERSGWELLTTFDLFLLTAGLVAICAALTGGRVGVFRPDVSLNGAADLFGVVSSILMACFLIFDFPDGAAREPGAFLALIGALVVAGGAGDYSTVRGAPLFPRLEAGERPRG